MDCGAGRARAVAVQRSQPRRVGADPEVRTLRRRVDRGRAGVRAVRDHRRGWRDLRQRWPGVGIPSARLRDPGARTLARDALVRRLRRDRAHRDPHRPDRPCGDPPTAIRGAAACVRPEPVAAADRGVPSLRHTDVRRRDAEARSEWRPTNAIPRTIADRLKHGEVRIADAYPDTTVVFADLVGFTPWAQRTDPALVVALLDDLFSRLDELTEVHGVQKVKTVGDAYMAVAGAQSRVWTTRRQLSALPGASSTKWPSGGTCTSSSSRSGWGSPAARWSAASSGARGCCSSAGATRSTPPRGWSRRAFPTGSKSPPRRARRSTNATRSRPGQVDVKGLGTMTTFLLVPEGDPGAGHAEDH